MIIVVVAVIGFSCLACGITSYGLIRWGGERNILSNDPVEVEVIPPLNLPDNLSQGNSQSNGDGSSDTLDTLLNAEIPINNPVDLAQRLEGKENLPLTLPVTES